ncbi:MAG: metal-dependent transcriptional regulator [Bacteroidetes bacterium]|nr:MAG: metal-dependent transcriptional regulator [Bacteroidota bacterium]
MLSFTEENYLKALHNISEAEGVDLVGTNRLAAALQVKPATANDMLKKLKEKSYVAYEKYGKIKLTDAGAQYAVAIIRKHRLWETFLYQKLEFSWDEVHEVAEQLEHIQSEKLIDKLDKFLAYPAFDPHGDPIPNQKGAIKVRFKTTLLDVAAGASCRMVAVKDNSKLFLQYVANLGLGLNAIIKVVAKQDYDASTQIEVAGKQTSVSEKFASNIFVICNTCKVGQPCPGLRCQV